jgi:hypothetical protein
MTSRSRSFPASVLGAAPKVDRRGLEGARASRCRQRIPLQQDDFPSCFSFRTGSAFDTDDDGLSMI